jgi:peptidoglycan/LPS O-acetylase OafA/YrhL
MPATGYATTAMNLFRGNRSLATAVELYDGELRSATGLRVMAVLAVLIALSIESTDSFARYSTSPLWVLGTYATSALFALTGYTLAGSRDRHDRSDFVLRRLRRAYPAVALSTAACFAVLGPLASTLGPRRYFADGEGWQFLLNLVGVPQLTLPGVFEFNALPDIINANFWAPLAFLLLVAVVTFATGTGRRRAIIVGGTAALFGVGSLVLDALDALPGYRADPIRLMLAGPGFSAILSGLAGVAAAWWGKRIPLGRLPLGIAAALLGGAAVIGTESWRGVPGFHISITLPATYVGLYLATKQLPFIGIANRLYGPSAGFLLYAPPIQQLVASTAIGGSSGFANAALALPLALVVSCATWWLIERRLTATQRLTHPAFATRVDLPPKRRDRTWRERVERGAIALAVGIVLVVLMTAIMAMTFYAMQRPIEGM